MPRVSIEYLNARRDATRKGATIFAPETRAVDIRAREAQESPLERAENTFERALLEFNRITGELIEDLRPVQASHHGVSLDDTF